MRQVLLVHCAALLVASCITSPPSGKDVGRGDVGRDANASDVPGRNDVSAPSDAGRDADRLARLALRIPAGSIDEPLQDFVVLVDGASPVLQSIEVGQLRFTSTVGDRLYPHEVETFNPAAGRIRAWVRLPEVSSAADTEFALEVSPTPVVTEPSSTWQDWVGVWHFEEGNFGDGDPVHDSSPESNDGIARGGADTSAGMVGAAIALDGEDDRIEISDDDSLRPSQAVTLSAWINASEGAFDSIIARPATSIGVDFNNSYQLYLDGDGLLSTCIAANDEANVNNTSEVPTGEWVHVAMAFDGESTRQYLNGSFDGAQPVPGQIQYVDTTVYIGGDINDADLALPFAGLIDEARILPRAASATRIRAWHDNQRDPASFVLWPEGEDQAGF
jgi:hypothetical protein